MPNPPDHWTAINVAGLSSAAVLQSLNQAASAGFNTVAVAVKCTDGEFVFVGGYSSSEQ